MHLVQLLIPIYDNERRRFSDAEFRTLRDELVDEFGGLTAYTRSTAEGLWRDGESDTAYRDEIVVYEVMCDTIDRAWWSDYRATLERRFRQDELVIRVQQVERL
jgi:hypothetical protein